jgi:hypothetical protein
MISLLITLLVFALIFWAIRTVLPVLGLPEPVSTILYVILVLVMALYLLSALGLLVTPFHHL